MKAIVLERQGPPDVLTLRDVEVPRIGEDEVLVRVEAAGVNRLDVWVRSGVYKTEMPRVLGSEAAGVVSEVGGKVSHLSVGDRVFIDPALTDGSCSFCLQGKQSLCENLKLVGFGADGCYAEYVKVPAVNVHPIPRGWGFEEAAALAVNYFTAWHCLMARASLQPGSTVLVVGGGSGVGVAAIQISKLLGAEVIALVGDEWKREKARGLGADHVLNRRRENIVEEVLRLTGGKGVDIVFEHAGEKMWETALKSLRPGGTMVFFGATSGDEGRLSIRYAYRRQLNLVGSYSWDKKDVFNTLKILETGRLKPVIDTVYPLADASKSHMRMERDEHFGKIILKP
ncbi:Alcohol dehydrogenase [archaeon HR01]|nr:Alcohol dehydrogenase [archaeon HR01]